MVFQISREICYYFEWKALTIYDKIPTRFGWNGSN